MKQQFRFHQNVTTVLALFGALVFAPGLTPMARAQATVSRVEPTRDVGIDQRLNNQAPMDAPFLDETGKTVKFGDMVGDKPTILVLPFYKCAGACTLEMNELSKTLTEKKFGFTPGKEFNVITVSIDAKEKPELALAKKNQYQEEFSIPNMANGWHFLTGPQDSITRLCQAVGFRYVYDAKNGQPVHAAGIMLLTPQGKVSRYFLGTTYRPRDLRLSLIEASQNKIGSLAEKVILYCIHYDDGTGRYSVAVMNVLKVACAGTLLILAGFVLLMRRIDRRIAAGRSAENSPQAPLPQAGA